MEMKAKEETTEAFGARLGGMVESGFLCLAMGMGNRLKLFDAVLTAGTAAQKEGRKGATSEEIAKAAGGLRERYVREWLGAMVCGNLVDVEESGREYWISEVKAPLLRHGANSPLGFGSFLNAFAKAADMIEGCFDPKGPRGMPYEAYPGFYDFMSSISTQRAKDHLVQDFIPSVPGLLEKFKSGIKYLDVGCGLGVPSRIVASAFPASESWGIDITAEAIRRASAVSPPLSNLHYEAMDGGALRPDWSDSFDYVTAFDAIHDQGRPDLALAEIFRVLKPGGIFSMLDIRGTSNPCKDRDAVGSGGLPLPGMCYSISLLHCMPVSLNAEGGMGLGAMWGEAKAREMLAEAGFLQVDSHPIAYDPFNSHFIARKPL